MPKAIPKGGKRIIQVKVNFNEPEKECLDKLVKFYDSDSSSTLRKPDNPKASKLTWTIGGTIVPPMNKESSSEKFLNPLESFCLCCQTVRQNPNHGLSDLPKPQFLNVASCFIPPH